jgi:hypothetical protein
MSEIFLPSDAYQKKTAAHEAQRSKIPSISDQFRSNGLAAAGTVTVKALAALLAIHSLAA